MRLSILFFLVVIACVFASESNVEDRAKTGAPVTKAPKPTKVPVKTTNSHGAKTTHARKNLNAGRASTKPPVPKPSTKAPKTAEPKKTGAPKTVQPKTAKPTKARH